MKPVEIYTTPFCGFCMMAKRLLTRKGIAFTEINVMGEDDKRAEMMKRAGGRRTVPQIFVGNTHVGGCDDLFALDEAGRLEPLLAA